MIIGSYSEVCSVHDTLLILISKITAEICIVKNSNIYHKRMYVYICENDDSLSDLLLINDKSCRYVYN